MVANLIVMINISGYILFVSKLNIWDNEDRPEELDKTTAATLKIKLASALVGVSGIHLLKSFVELDGEVILHGAADEHAVAEHFLNHKPISFNASGPAPTTLCRRTGNNTLQQKLDCL